MEEAGSSFGRVPHKLRGLAWQEECGYDGEGAGQVAETIELHPRHGVEVGPLDLIEVPMATAMAWRSLANRSGWRAWVAIAQRANASARHSEKRLELGDVRLDGLWRALPGIGPKTVRFFLLHSRRGFVGKTAGYACTGSFYGMWPGERPQIDTGEGAAL